jgi:hypothetical protein
VNCCGSAQSVGAATGTLVSQTHPAPAPLPSPLKQRPSTGGSPIGHDEHRNSPGRAQSHISLGAAGPQPLESEHASPAGLSPPSSGSLPANGPGGFPAPPSSPDFDDAVTPPQLSDAPITTIA